MSKKSSPLTEEELEEIARRRAEARRRGQQLLDDTSDEDDAAIIAAAEADSENPPVRDFSRFRPAHEVAPEIVARQLRRGRGRPKLVAPKRQVTLRLDADVIDGLRSTGRGWQTRVNEALRQWLRRTGS